MDVPKSYAVHKFALHRPNSEFFIEDVNTSLVLSKANGNISLSKNNNIVYIFALNRAKAHNKGAKFAFNTSSNNIDYTFRFTLKNTADAVRFIAACGSYVRWVNPGNSQNSQAFNLGDTQDSAYSTQPHHLHINRESIGPCDVQNEARRKLDDFLCISTTGSSLQPSRDVSPSARSFALPTATHLSQQSYRFRDTQALLQPRPTVIERRSETQELLPTYISTTSAANSQPVRKESTEPKANNAQNMSETALDDLIGRVVERVTNKIGDAIEKLVDGVLAKLDNAVEAGQVFKPIRSRPHLLDRNGVSESNATEKRAPVTKPSLPKRKKKSSLKINKEGQLIKKSAAEIAASEKALYEIKRRPFVRKDVDTLTRLSIGLRYGLRSMDLEKHPFRSAD